MNLRRFLGSHLAASYGSTRKGNLLESVPLGTVTLTFPLVAPAGTVAVIWDLETTVNDAGVPLKLTLVVPTRSVPRIDTCVPTFPARATVSTNGFKPTDNLKTVPHP